MSIENALYKLFAITITLLLLLNINVKTGDVSIEFISGGNHHKVVAKFDQFLKQNTITKDLASTDL